MNMKRRKELCHVASAIDLYVSIVKNSVLC